MTRSLAAIPELLYKARNIVERLYNKAKQFPRIATYDKLAENYLVALKFVSISISQAIMSLRPKSPICDHF
ncbi:hypothetical protein [Mesorhizobium sp. 43Arga]